MRARDDCEGHAVPTSAEETSLLNLVALRVHGNTRTTMPKDAILCPNLGIRTRGTTLSSSPAITSSHVRLSYSSPFDPVEQCQVGYVPPEHQTARALRPTFPLYQVLDNNPPPPPPAGSSPLSHSLNLPSKYVRAPPSSTFHCPADSYPTRTHTGAHPRTHHLPPTGSARPPFQRPSPPRHSNPPPP